LCLVFRFIQLNLDYYYYCIDLLLIRGYDIIINNVKLVVKLGNEALETKSSDKSVFKLLNYICYQYNIIVRV